MADWSHRNKRPDTTRKTGDLPHFMAPAVRKELPKCTQGGLLLEVV